ncbi:hypothetical protein [Comamonas brasiliensis]|uniref:hypothetical protein n=1 Tax=Comamonas brasiliensis TaxID=1812482 RepID=UPI001B8CA809|nr:hypothetical protein [Comamonas sp. PE63]
MDYKKCSSYSNDPLVVVEENKCKFTVVNKSKSRILKLQVDKCLVTDDRERCDWMIGIESEDNLRMMYVELKGKNVDKAISQLKSTISFTKDKFSKHARECYIVTTRFPKGGVEQRKLIMDFRKSTNAPLSFKNIMCSVTV